MRLRDLKAECGMPNKVEKIVFYDHFVYNILAAVLTL